ncbi:hypothetical protein V1524DRAFT_208608 [Lipomyces starkeyi]
MLHFSTSPLVLYVSLVISFAHFCNFSPVYRMPEALCTSLVPQPDDTELAFMPSAGQKRLASVTLVDGHTTTSASTTYCMIDPVIHTAIEVTDETEDHRGADSKKVVSSENSQHPCCDQDRSESNMDRCTCKASIERVPTYCRRAPARRTPKDKDVAFAITESDTKSVEGPLGVKRRHRLIL